MRSLIEDIEIKKVEIIVSHPTPTLRVRYDLIDSKGRVYGSGEAPSGWDPTVLKNMDTLLTDIHNVLVTHLFYGETQHVGTIKKEEESPQGLFPNHGTHSI